MNCPTVLKSVNPRTGNTEVTQLAGHRRDSRSGLLADQLGIQSAVLKRMEVNMKFENLLEGSLLGDGAIAASFDKRQNTTNYYYTESHGPKQEGYLRWKADHFLKKGMSARVHDRKRVANIKGRPIHSHEYRFASYSNSTFKTVREQWYPNGTKEVPGDLELTPEKIAVWYMDDGCYDLFRSKIEIYTNGFNKQSQHILQRELAKFNIKVAKWLTNDVS